MPPLILDLVVLIRNIQLGTWEGRRPNFMENSVRYRGAFDSKYFGKSFNLKQFWREMMKIYNFNSFIFVCCSP